MDKSTLQRFLRKWSWAERIAMVGFALFIGWLDYVTGPDFSIILFYALSIAWIAWRNNLIGSLTSTLAIAAMWATVNIYFAPDDYPVSLELRIWNGLMVLGVFLAVALAINRMKHAYDSQRKLNIQLQAAQRELAVLEGLVPVCAWCKSIRTTNGSWVSIESFITSASPSKVTHSICPTCESNVTK